MRFARFSKTSNSVKNDIDSCYFQMVDHRVTSNDHCEACHNFENEVSELNKTRESWCTDFHFQDPYINDTIVTEHNLICQYQWLSETIFSVGNVGKSNRYFFTKDLKIWDRQESVVSNQNSFNEPLIHFS